MDATLALPTANEFRQTNPIPGITEISAVQVNNNIRVTITGEKQAPVAEVIRSPQNLVLNITPEASTAQSQPDNVTPEASTVQSQPDEELEIIVTGEREDNDYFVPDATSAARTDTPILDTPQSVQIIPQKVLEDQQVIRLDEALRNVSGVTFGGTNLGRSLEFSIRGFDEAPILRNGFRQFGADVVQETANLERVEVLKGPASVLYGEIEPGGLINLVTKKPTSTPFYEIQTHPTSQEKRSRIFYQCLSLSSHARTNWSRDFSQSTPATAISKK